MFASIEDSDSDPDNHGEDSSSNTSADDHMTTKRSQCRLQGAGVKEVRELLTTSNRTNERMAAFVFTFHDSVLFIVILFISLTIRMLPHLKLV